MVVVAAEFTYSGRQRKRRRLNDVFDNDHHGDNVVDPGNVRSNWTESKFSRQRFEHFPLSSTSLSDRNGASYNQFIVLW